MAGVIRSSDLILVYALIANQAQNRFKLTVSERTSGMKLCEHQVIRESTEDVVRSEYKHFDYPLLGIEHILKKLL